MKKIIYQCDFCDFSSEFIDQEIWLVTMPLGYSMNEDETPKSLKVYEQYVCLKHGIEVYKSLMKIKNINVE